jgi:integrase
MPYNQDPKRKTWFYRFSRNGQSYFKGGYRTASQAKEAEASFYDRIVSEEIHPERKGQDLLFSEAVAWYLGTLPVSKKTASIDKARLGLAALFFDNKKLSELQPEDIERFLEKLPALRSAATPRLKKLSEQTKNHYLAVIRGLFHRMRKRGKYLGPNPALSVEFRKVPKARVRFLYPAEEKMLSPVVREDAVLWPYYFMAMHTGMRIRELMAIRVKDIDLVLDQIFIPNSKNSRSRYAPLSPNAAAFVRVLVNGKNHESRLLPNWSYTYLRKRFKDCCDVARIENLKIHDIRHSFCQRLLSHGESIYLVSKLMGHSSVGVTQAHYGHLAISDLTETIARIDGAFSCSQVADGNLQTQLKQAVKVL